MFLNLAYALWDVYNEPVKIWHDQDQYSVKTIMILTGLWVLTVVTPRMYAFYFFVMWMLDSRSQKKHLDALVFACTVNLFSCNAGVVWSIAKVVNHTINPCASCSKSQSIAWLCLHILQTFVFLYFAGFINRHIILIEHKEATDDIEEEFNKKKSMMSLKK